MTEKAKMSTKTTNISTMIKMKEMKAITSDQDATDRLIDCAKMILSGLKLLLCGTRNSCSIAYTTQSFHN